ncbi:MAG: hypothetical protein Q7U84_07005, partial [Polynucleobacter sp.]|nr:hypothetical protein [Polynucleobacter sp.]
FYVSAAGDINGDGLSDLMLSSPAAYGGKGATWVVYGSPNGGDFYTHQAGQGFTSGNDTLTGTSASETLIGGQGNDLIISGGGTDKLYGGQGNDIFRVSATTLTGLTGPSSAFTRIDGGTGDDTLELDGAGMTLTLSNAMVTSGRLASIEKIDITGSGNNTLIISDSKIVSNLSESSAGNSVYVNGDAGDKVSLGSDWTYIASAEGYARFGSGISTATLYVGASVTTTLLGFNLLGLSNGGASGYSVSDGTASFSDIGRIVSGAGDVNGDAYDDFLVYTSNAVAANRSVFVVYGGTSGANREISTINQGTGGFAINGAGLASNYMGIGGIGDFNGDGFSDVAIADVSAPTRSYVVFGKTSAGSVSTTSLDAGIGGLAIDTISPSKDYRLSRAGDVNGDGYADLILGENSTNAYVVFGKATTEAISLATIAAGSGGGFRLQGNSTYGNMTVS